MSRNITIGIHVYEDPAGLRRTLEAVARNTRAPHRILLLGDGPDANTTVAMSATRLPQSSTPSPLGAPACFNRLIRQPGVDVFVLLESGCIPASGWLESLLDALDADPRNMLAGPSTNLCWNQQGTIGTTTAALIHFGEHRTLEPLYSLADFCYAVKREAVEALGEADERYGLGPCWEMDFNIRAARAGFRGVWACGSFIFRPSMPRRRQAAEAQWFDRNRRLYQDKFCGFRLRGEPHAYEPHCRGDDCEHFAPSELLQISQQPAAEPLVSCVMVTRGRPEYVAQSIRYFERQTWTHRELIIVYDDDADLPDAMPADIRAFRVPGKQSIGAKRNYGCEQARGETIAQWDDDDWYGPERLRAQSDPVVRGHSDITGLRTETFFDVDGWRFWSCTDTLHARIFRHDVHGGTLVYRKSIWENLSRYPSINLAEDAAFLDTAVRRGARLRRIDTPGLFIYLRHRTNSWKFQCGEFCDPQSWRSADEPACLNGDVDFYRAKTPAKAAPAIMVHRDPLVTCIMPTADRPHFVPRSIEYFRRQHYPQRELLIVDDGASSVRHLVPEDDPRIRYLRLDTRHSIGAKRNLACAESRGEVILHWDDDDWMAEWRISYQVQALLRGPEQMVWGLNRVLYYDTRLDRAWLYCYPPEAPAWVGGNTLCYRKALAMRHPFPDLNEGEDTRFVWSLPHGSLSPLNDHTFIVAMIHGANASPKMTADRRWQSQPTDEIRRLMQSDLPNV